MRLSGNEKSNNSFEKCRRYFKYCRQGPTRLGFLRTANFKVRSQLCFARWTGHKHSPDAFREAELLATFRAIFHNIFRHKYSIPAMPKKYQTDFSTKEKTQGFAEVPLPQLVEEKMAFTNRERPSSSRSLPCRRRVPRTWYRRRGSRSNLLLPPCACAPAVGPEPDHTAAPN